MKPKKVGMGIAIAALTALVVRDVSKNDAQQKQPQSPARESSVIEETGFALPFVNIIEDKYPVLATELPLIESATDLALADEEIISKPTEEEMKDISFMRDFLVKYKIVWFNYDSIDDLLEALNPTYEEALAESKGIDWLYLRGIGAEKFKTDKLAQSTIKEKVRRGIVKDCEDCSVVLETENKPASKSKDSPGITRPKDLTISTLRAYAGCVRNFQNMLHQALPNDTFTFPGGSGLPMFESFISAYENTPDHIIRQLPPGIKRAKHTGYESEKTLASQ